ncbi:MAG: 4-hydroxy-tetrahydrodipicolinate reductase [Alphaproteobacteria bacterium]|nr:4-hydroxy-tetrahydrodipicolinate reductase [Alphaproteobacteria bacterium]
MTLRLAIAGAEGRMGAALIRAAHASADARVVGATERPGSAALGQDAGVLAGLHKPLGVTVLASCADAAANADAWIDFTTPDATIAALKALKGVRAAIIGTTGFNTAEHQDVIRTAAQRFAVVRSGNFSLGVAMLAALTRIAAARLGPDWDIEITEAHHRHKVDAPSGTALMLGEAAAQGRAAPLERLELPARDGVTGPRPSGGIGFSVIRGGGIVGEHDVAFAAEREVLRLSHQALDRAVFADGALEAARWAVNQPPGLYAMDDVLGLKA